MLTVHGAWVDDRLTLWAEAPPPPDPARPDSGPPDSGPPDSSPRNSGPPAARSAARRRGPRPHPYAVAAPALAAALGRGEPGHHLALLPGHRSAPAPSPDSGRPPVGRRPRLARWQVPTVALTADEALRLLADLDEAGADGSAAPWRPGGSVRYLAVVAGYACALVHRGRLLPQLVAEGDGRAARWRPVRTGADVEAHTELLAAMPAACRALAAPDGAPPGVGEALDGVLAALVDAAARRLLPDRLLRGARPGPRTDAADRWLWALTAADATVALTAAEADALARPLRRWYDAAHASETGTRVCFRLVEPLGPTAVEPVDNPVDNSSDQEIWRVEWALQSVDDPSLYVPAGDVWAGARPPGLPERPDEVLLAGLGRASRLFPALHAALRDAAPQSWSTDTAGAHEFLRDSAPLLRAAGFGVQLPAWAGRTSLGVRLTARSRPDGPGAVGSAGVGRTELVDFSLSLAIGDAAVDEAALTALAAQKVPLIRVRGQWVELDDRQLSAALALLRRRRSGTLTVAEALREVAGGEDILPITHVDADGVLGDLLSGAADQRLRPTPTPAALAGSLRPYQQRGLSWLAFLARAGLGGILADDMGLGKTVTTLALLLHQREAGRAGPTLMVCPMSLVSNWEREAARFAPDLRVHVHHGGGRLRGDALAAAVADHDLVITTYGTALRDLDELRAQPWDRVVCDEAQAIKNSGTRQARAVRAIPARTRLALTGTPVENHLAELWSLMEFCNPGLLGPAASFRERYQRPIETGAADADDAAAALRRATGPLMLRRLKTDRTIITDLPEKVEVTEWCRLTPEQATLYQAVVNDMMGVIAASAGMERRGNVLAAMTKLKQVCNHPAHLLGDGSRLPGRSGKLARLEELAAEIVAEGDKALVFTQYAAFGTMLRPYLEAQLGRPVLWLHGGLPKAQRDALVHRFQTDDEPMIFLLSLKAAGTGLNLTAANHVLHVDRWWNPAVEDQATDRAFRIGQRRNVQVRKFVCVGTLEERVDALIRSKRALAERVVGAGEDWLTELSTDDLRDLLRLDPAAVA
ncbi:helicase HelZ [Pilimelia terevasa]|uniref:Helicase HelZ n=1 Tax=Pilimelia terevasa TaxID=53372 RepID=A0A8J3FHG5_9ACTN|nr:DEAD/DEAH box helicase [Pilimelia terevasa]GGK21195.1 helicase HelZ [Pilimelia terevasa]